ncbi:MAG TPA: hypothetical protein VMM35_02040 [Longimicrobiales bacterium]|nr:hypothetical protein [Longimicrobiales bacterium]
MSSISWRTLALAGALVAAPLPTAAQAAAPAPSVRAGTSQYDLAGTGTAPFVALGVDIPVVRRLLLEPGIAYLPYESQAGARTHHLLPEIQLQWTGTGRGLRPYLGAGLGASWAIRPGEDRFDPTLSTAAGLRVATDSGWIVRGELRVRAIDPWTGTSADWGIGVGRVVR